MLFCYTNNAQYFVAHIKMFKNTKYAIKSVRTTGSVNEES